MSVDHRPRGRGTAATPDPSIGLLLATVGVLVSLIGIVAILQARVWIVLWLGLGLTVLGVCGFFLLGLFGRGYRAEGDRLALERRNQAALDYIENLDALDEMTRPRTAPTAQRITEVTLSRGQSLEPCPVYAVALRRDGTASWHGEAGHLHGLHRPDFTERLGDFTGNFIEDQFVLLAKVIAGSGFFDWSETYDSPVTDQATTSLEVTIGSTEKWRVSVYGNGPRGFGAVTEAVDALANEVNWRGSA